ncbi:MAG: 4'-phosphopantetheinyl transferase superfamily protein [Defluviitaleaceae bacterium]|nr:4'-phosphopantetheinyl transferase superfamily protein [Defluviitaleaceae bacterium]
MIIGIGISVIDICRFSKDVFKNKRLMNRSYTPVEQMYLKDKDALALAELYAAKEAVIRALCNDFQGFSPHDIEILYDEFGMPSVIFHERVLGILKNQVRKQHKQDGAEHFTQLCISHTDEIAVATAIITISSSK